MRLLSDLNIHKFVIVPGAVGDGGVEVKVRDGGRALLPCRGTVVGTPRWRHRGEPIAQDPRYHIDRITSNLIITRARPSDSGPWACSQHSPAVHLVVLGK